MRPRGESASLPVNRKVGQASRQNPHRMHFSAFSAALSVVATIATFLYSADEPSGAEETVGIERLLHCPHQVKVSARRPPHVAHMRPPCFRNVRPDQVTTFRFKPFEP